MKWIVKIPLLSNEDLYDVNFQWILRCPCSNKTYVHSRKFRHSFQRLVLNGYFYEHVDFDFEKREIYITMSFYSQMAISNILQCLTIYKRKAVSFSIAVNRKKHI